MALIGMWIVLGLIGFVVFGVVQLWIGLYQSIKIVLDE